MFGERWELPLHLMNAVFGAQTEDGSEDLQRIRAEEYEGWSTGVLSSVTAANV